MSELRIGGMRVANLPKQNACISCRWFDDNGEGNPGSCHRRAPTAFIVPTKLGQIGNMSVFAPVTRDSWCGEHELALTLDKRNAS